MPKLNRRSFLQSSALSAGPLFAIGGTKSSGRIRGANEAIHVAVAGIRGRGQAHIDAFARQADCRVSCLVDPDSSLFASRRRRVEDLAGNKPVCLQDVRRALERADVDAVSVATCNHWHALITIWACQAGKDVYVEKPLSHSVFEGRQCVAAAAKYERIVQHGTQQRSDATRAGQIAAIRSGRYGKLLVAKGYCCKPRWSIGDRPAAAPPAGLDFDHWLGPAPRQSYHANLHPYNWHWFWDFGNGDTGNQGVHEMDVARWSIPGATLPNRVWSLGGRYLPGEFDQGETPNMLLSVFEFDAALLVFETRGLVGRGDAPASQVANEFHTTDGVIRDWKFFPHGSVDGEPVRPLETATTAGGPFGSFLSCVRTRATAAVNCDAAAGHYSSALCHLANISHRLGMPQPLGPETAAAWHADPVAQTAWDNLRDNLQRVGVAAERQSITAGRPLVIDTGSERIIGDDHANALLSRPYRQPYVVPETV